MQCHVKITFTTTDLITIGTDAIVNAANSELAEGGGVCVLIFAACGRAKLAQACAPLGRCEVGSAVITPSFDLTTYGTTHIIHAVGPRWDDRRPSQCDEQLASAYRSSLMLAEQQGIQTVAFPAISTGIFRFPVDRAASIVGELLAQEKFEIDEIIHVALSQETTDTYRSAYERAAGRSRTS